MTDIHIVAPFLDANSEDWQAIDLYLSLRKESNVHLWSSHLPNEVWSKQYSVSEIKPYQGKLPTSGTLYVVGTTTEIGYWYEQARFERIVVIHNLFSPNALYKNLNRLTLNGTRKVEIQYVSNMAKESIGLPGKIAYPLPHPERFQPLERPAIRNQFTVGRMSRNSLSKHYYGDPSFYRKLAAHGMRVCVVGGACLRPWLIDDKNVKLLAEIPQSVVPEILNTFDCFFYRTSLNGKGAFEDEVIEAMLCGLPVVCHRQGGSAEMIEHEVNGFLFETEEEAFEIITRLKNDADLRKAIGQKAKFIR